ncbi:translocation and assembly module TamB [Modicisalibacter ilicicola DSM 19980]|uniref:Translocation and assembly module TamB n=1 Tax=Modicisalibacter ilicicola DSM 19980 TaxID=1121942 RepID=A0A1M4XFQ2_9GAMM|nr:translocation/assembly module TamB domain-containing protein [Halomonas ilicicola]SHE92241.1 translocation and assembly module TamB [Halomonas ilicicola DSM 19980]
MILPLLRLLLWLPIWLLGLLFLLLGLALSPWGTSWLMSQAESRGLLQVESVSGAPLDRLTLTGLELAAGPAQVQIERLHLAWSEDCLLNGKLCLDALQLAGVEVRLEQGETTEEAPPSEASGGGGLPPVVLPFPVELRAIELRDVDVRLADGTHLTWQRFTTGARLAGNTFTLLPTRLVDSELRLPVSPGQALTIRDTVADDTSSETDQAMPAAAQQRLAGEAIDAANGVAARDTEDLAASGDEEPKPPDTRPLAQRERLTLPAIELPMAVNAPSLVIEDFRIAGPTEQTIERLALSLKGRGHEIRVESLALASSMADAELTASVTLNDDYPLQLDLDARIRHPMLAGERLELSLDGSLAELSADLDATGPVAARLEARADVLAPTLPFDVSLNAERLEWPLATSEQNGDGEQAARTTPGQYVVQDLALQAEGDLAAYDVALSGDVSGTALPRQVQVALKGQGNLEHFAWTPLALSTDSGALISRGEARWAPSVDVDATLNLEDFNLGAFTEAFSGRLDGDARAHFALNEAGGWQVDIPELAIDGTLQERPLSLEARLNGNSEMRWNIQRLRLRQGDNRLTAQGRIEKRIDLSGELDAPALETLLPELGGQARGRFALGGTLEAPQLDLSLSGSDLRHAQNRLENLSLEADIEGLDDPRLDVGLAIDGLDAAGQRFSAIDLDLEGRLSDHRLDVSADAAESMPLSRASLVLQGGLNAARDRYKGRLTALEVDSEQADLRLEDALAFTANLTAGSVEAAPFCLVRRQGGKLCATETLKASAERGEGGFSLSDFPMDVLSAVLPENWSAAGQTDGRFRASWAPGGRWSAQAQLESRLSVDGRDAYGQPWALPEATLTADLDASAEQARLQGQLSLAEAGQLNLDLQVDDPTGETALDGRLRIDDFRLSPYRRLTTALQRLEGALNADIGLDGSLQEPRLDGNLRLSELRAQGDDIPVEVRDGRLEARLRGDNATLEGFVEAEDGRIDLAGEARWPAPDEWVVELSLDGSDTPVLVALPDFGRLRVAPDLDVRASPELLRLRGEVRVPWARLSVAGSPPSAIAPSSDEVIITREDEAEAKRQAERAVEEAAQGADEATSEALAEAGMQLDVEVELILGPDVQLEAYGLETDLAGTLQVRQGDGPVQLFGDVNLEDGRYKAFGQDLLIRRGQVLFSGPASQPRLQFEAIRNPEVTEDDVIAGLRVTGPAEQPRLSIFSEPAMDESRALSYLLRGRAPDEQGAGADSALTSALIGLSLSRTGNAVGQVGQAFGIDDLSLDTAGSGEDSQVVVSGYLFEDLRVSYGVGIFSPIAELTLRYKLLQNLYVQAVSGAAQAVDLIYTFSLGRSDGDP